MELTKTGAIRSFKLFKVLMRLNLFNPYFGYSDIDAVYDTWRYAERHDSNIKKK